jgi:hypothetical protein
VVKTDAGRIRPGVWAVGEVVGTTLSPSSILAEAERVAAAILADGP